MYKQYFFFSFLILLFCVSGNAQKPQTHNAHEYVDLGLPSGVKWATCNVGANRPEEYGDYFAWGETSAKSDYSPSNCLTYNKNMAQMYSSGILSSEGALAPSYDAAAKNWGGLWRIPTLNEIKELIGNTIETWTTKNGVYGRKLTSRHNGKSIFLPATGYRHGTSLYDDGVDGYFWSSTPLEDGSQCSYLLLNFSDYFDWYDYRRFHGFTVRPVTECNIR
ncbi:MAG: hypothetical protein HUK08_03510 [Bacteroidaceae bacterium]|nr:hypothetical protein [Bacteroidaceae bacterium]